MANNRIVATYRIETPFAPEQAAEALAGEQSSGTFVSVPGETEELREKHRARVERVTPLETVSTPSLSGSRIPTSGDGAYHRAEVEISFPFENIGANLPTLVATVAGNLFELAEFSGLKLLDLQIPAAFSERYPGPRFGIAGTRRLADVWDRPFIGTIIKPSVGLSPAQTAELVGTLLNADIDFIKDDELMADPPHSPLAERVAAVMRVVNKHAERTGKKAMVAFNITDDLDQMRRHHDTIVAHSGTCVMISLNSVGYAAAAELARHSRLPIHGHRNGWGMLTRHPQLGIEFPAYQKLWRLAGVDHLHVNGIQNKFWEPDDSVERSIKACLTPMFAETDRALPIVSSGQSGLQAPETFRRVQTTDLMYLAGGGVMAHPGGPAAGVRALRQCWEAAVAGTPLEEFAKKNPELAQSLEKFGKTRR